MKSIDAVLHNKRCINSETNEDGIINLYDGATKDYEFWSKDLNMHFGYYRPFKTNPFKRDTMLNEMNHQLFSRLQVTDTKAHIVDLGCGIGGTMKYGVSHYPKLAITGCTISPFQVNNGNKFIHSDRAVIENKDYRNTKFKENKFDGALAVESFCHSGCSKDSLKEAYRILKPNSRLVIADAFIKKEEKEMNLLSRTVHKGLSECWSLESLGNINTVKNQLEVLGFKEIRIENIWYRVAPSVLHVPFAILGFIFQKLWTNKPIKKESIDNMKGSFYALLSSLCLQDFGYYIVSARK